jgi:two-component system, LytTR family, sensor kinase
MGKPVYRKLIITALVTSIAFGGFSALNFYIFKELAPSGPINKVRIFSMAPGEPLPKMQRGDGIPIHEEAPGVKKKANSQFVPFSTISNNDLSILNNSLFTIGGMLFVWLFNIGILLMIEKTGIRVNRRALIRYIASYIVIVLITLTYVFVNNSDKAHFKFNGTYPDGTGHARFVLSNSRPTPTLGMRVQESQLPFMAAIVINTIVLAILELILLQHHKGQMELENTQLKMSHLVAKHNHLKHQLQPHFLFNSLTTLKSLIKRSPAEAEEYLVRLSVVLRSSLARNELNVIPLSEELHLCIDYMGMQKIRFGDAFNYVINIPEPLIQSIFVPAFSLQLLVENAIKHNAFTTDKPLTISISYSEEGYIQVRNNKNIKMNREPSPSIGLQNLSERYKMISGNDIIFMTDENDFIVKIKTLNG